MNIGLVVALVKGGKAVLMSKPVRLALARFILESVEKHEPKKEK